MSGVGKPRLAELVIDQHGAFRETLAGSRKRYPTREFRSFAAMIRQYVRGYPSPHLRPKLSRGWQGGVQTAAPPLPA